jgi:hypothetical protein
LVVFLFLFSVGLGLALSVQHFGAALLILSAHGLILALLGLLTTTQLDVVVDALL